MRFEFFYSRDAAEQRKALEHDPTPAAQQKRLDGLARDMRHGFGGQPELLARIE